MKDINLFSHQVNKKKDVIKKSSYKRVFIYIAVFLAIMLIGSWVYIQKDIMDNSKRIAAYESKINDSETIAKLKEYNDLKNESSNIESYITVLTEVDKAVILAETITSDRLKSIRDIMPKNMSIISMTMEKEIIEISGECGIKDSVAEFAHNLKQLEFMESVFVSNIRADNKIEKFPFTINCVTKGGVE